MTLATNNATNSDCVRRRARRFLPKFLFDYIDGGAGEERCLTENRNQLSDITVMSRPLALTGTPNCSTNIGGFPAAMPVLVAPIGLTDLIRPGGDIALANSANEVGIPFIQSGASLTSYRDLTTNPRIPHWYQIYVHDLSTALSDLDHLDNLGCRNVVVTVDMRVGGIRHRDRANHFGKYTSPRVIAQALLRPEWLLRLAIAKIAPPVTQQSLHPAIRARRLEQPFGWKQLQLLRDNWPGKLWVKGLLHPDDACRAASIGIDGVIVSNHGGRQLDVLPTAWRSLPLIRAALPDDFPVLADGGIRNGDDVARAIALGATAVLVGKPLAWALAAGGQRGATKWLQNLRDEFEVTMLLLGYETLGQLRSAQRMNTLDSLVTSPTTDLSTTELIENNVVPTCPIDHGQ